MIEAKIKLDHIKELSQDHVKTLNMDAVLEKINKLVSDGKDRLQIIADFDRTLTKSHVDGVPTLSSFCVFEEKCPCVPKTFATEAAQLKDKYHAIELDPNLSIEEKLPHIEKWWDESNNLLCGLEFEPCHIDMAVNEANVPFRDGCDEALARLSVCDVPVLVFSAGFGDVVLSTLKHKNVFHPNMHVISNFVKFEDKKCLGFQGDMIHIYNKNEHAIHNTTYFKDLMEKENVILLGDSLGDATMSEGIPHGTVLKIGFLNSNAIIVTIKQYITNDNITLENVTIKNIIRNMTGCSKIPVLVCRRRRERDLMFNSKPKIFFEELGVGNLSTKTSTIRKKLNKGVLIKNRNVYYANIRSVIFVLNFFCLFPVGRFQGKSKFYCYTLNVIALIIFCICGYISLSLVPSYLLELFTSVHLFDTFFSFIQSLILLNPIFVVSFVWLGVVRFFKQIEKWAVFQKSFQQITGNPLKLQDSKLTFYSGGSLVILILLPLTTYTYLFLYKKIPLTALIVAVYHTTSINYISYFYVMDAETTKNIVKAFNAQFKRVCMDNATSTTIQSYRLLFIQLVSSVKDGANMMTMSKLLCIIHKVIFIVIYIYILIIILITGFYTRKFEIDKIVMSITGLLPAVGFLFMYSNTAYELTQEFEKLKLDLLQVKTPAYSINTKAVGEMCLFLRCVEILSPVYDISGFIKVDRGLSLTIFAHLVTYLIILIQFKFTIEGHI